MVTEEIELRCPVGVSDKPGRLLAKLLRQGVDAHVNAELNLLEFACHDCLKNEKRKGHSVTRVLHRFNIIGELVETVTRP